MSHALLAIQNILQNSNICIGSRETILFAPFGKKKLTQFSGLPPTSVSYLNEISFGSNILHNRTYQCYDKCLKNGEHRKLF